MKMMAESGNAYCTREKHQRLLESVRAATAIISVTDTSPQRLELKNPASWLALSQALQRARTDALPGFLENRPAEFVDAEGARAHVLATVTTAFRAQAQALIGDAARALVMERPPACLDADAANDLCSIRGRIANELTALAGTASSLLGNILVTPSEKLGVDESRRRFEDLFEAMCVGCLLSMPPFAEDSLVWRWLIGDLKLQDCVPDRRYTYDMTMFQCRLCTRRLI